jgi:hypothetical protein
VRRQTGYPAAKPRPGGKSVAQTCLRIDSWPGSCDLQNLPPSPANPESLSGLIERVTFFNDDTGFAVIKAKAKGHRDLVTVEGSLPSVSPGEWLTAQGHWVQDKEFGLQFRAEMLTSTAPTTREGIEKYLGSGMVKGIGPVYARKLVEKFGESIRARGKAHSRPSGRRRLAL